MHSITQTHQTIDKELFQNFLALVMNQDTAKEIYGRSVNSFVEVLNVIIIVSISDSRKDSHVRPSTKSGSRAIIFDSDFVGILSKL